MDFIDKWADGVFNITVFDGIIALIIYYSHSSRTLFFKPHHLITITYSGSSTKCDSNISQTLQAILCLPFLVIVFAFFSKTTDKNVLISQRICQGFSVFRSDI